MNIFKKPKKPRLREIEKKHGYKMWECYSKEEGIFEEAIFQEDAMRKFFKKRAENSHEILVRNIQLIFFGMTIIFIMSMPLWVKP